MVGLYFSRAILSIATVLLIANAIVSPDFKSNFQRFFKIKPAVFLTLLFFITVFSGLHSENIETWLGRVRIKIPYLLLPLAICGIPKITTRQYKGLIYAFFIISVMACIGVGTNYLLHFEQMTERYKQGGAIKTPIIYVRFSLFVAFGIVCGGFLWFKKYMLRFQWERFFIAGGTLFLFIFLHILAVRTGIFALYNAIFISIIYFIIQKRKYLLGLTLPFLMAITLWSAYQFIPSLHNKLNYMRWDLQQYFEGNRQNMASDYMRLLSIETGIQITKEHSWVFGVGAGDLRDEMDKVYEAEYPNIPKKLLPHNQYIFVLASTGLLGLGLFIVCTFYPIFYQKNYKYPFFVCFNVVTFSSFLAETTIELQIGGSFYMIFVLTSLNYLNGESKEANLPIQSKSSILESEKE